MPPRIAIGGKQQEGARLMLGGPVIEATLTKICFETFLFSYV